MTKEKVQLSRKGCPAIKVYCLPDEKEKIEKIAKEAGMSVTSYLREVGQGYKISGIVDYEKVRELAKINGDLGRLGGLLKLWLTNDERTASFEPSTIRAVLSRINETQDAMAEVMEKIINPNKK